jgi:hypothetical protein
VPVGLLVLPKPVEDRTQDQEDAKAAAEEEDDDGKASSGEEFARRAV